MMCSTLLRYQNALTDPLLRCPIALYPSAFDHPSPPSPATQQASRAHDKRDLYNTCIVSQLSRNKYCLNQSCLTDGGNVNMVARQTSNMIDSWWQTIMVTRLLVARLIREHCYSCVEVLGKLLIPCCLCSPCSNGYLVKSAADVLNSPQEIYQGR